jgi:hypothetical protein
MMAPNPALKSIDGYVDRGHRGACWRPACRATNRQYRTISYEVGNVVVARCHGGEYRTLLDLCVELLAHAG